MGGAKPLMPSLPPSCVPDEHVCLHWRQVSLQLRCPIYHHSVPLLRVYASLPNAQAAAKAYWTIPKAFMSKAAPSEVAAIDAALAQSDARGIAPAIVAAIKSAAGKQPVPINYDMEVAACKKPHGVKVNSAISGILA